MNSLEPGFLERLPITPSLLKTIRQLGEYKGRQGLYRNQTPQVLETLRQVAVIQSTESSNRIEGIFASLDRIKSIVEHKSQPRNRPEQEIAGYRDALAEIHNHYRRIRVNTSLVRRLHGMLYAQASDEGGRWKDVDNEIVEFLPDGTWRTRFRPVPARDVAAAMTRLHQNYARLAAEYEVEPLLVIPAYVLDFLCIHPFKDGNGRVGRLLSLLLLYQAGYEVGRFISLEMLVEQSKEAYYTALNRSSQGWHEGKHDPRPWLEYFLGDMLTTAYHEFEHRVVLISQGKGAKTAIVLDYLEHVVGEFTARDVALRCPNVGLDLIRRILARERQAGRLKCLGRGQSAHWRRT